MRLTKLLCSILNVLALSDLKFLLVTSAGVGKKQELKTNLAYDTNNPMECICSKLTIH